MHTNIPTDVHWRPFGCIYSYPIWPGRLPHKLIYWIAPVRDIFCSNYVQMYISGGIRCVSKLQEIGVMSLSYTEDKINQQKCVSYEILTGIMANKCSIIMDVKIHNRSYSEPILYILRIGFFRVHRKYMYLQYAVVTCPAVCRSLSSLPLTIRAVCMNTESILAANTWQARHTMYMNFV